MGTSSWLANLWANAVGPVPLVLDLRIAHERWVSRSDPTLNGNLHYPNDIDRSLHESTTDKMRKYRVDCNNNPPNSIPFMPVVPSTSGRLHSEFLSLLFLQDHRETDHFFAVSGVQFAQSNSGLFHFHHSVFTNLSWINLVSIFRCSSPPRNPVHARRVDP